MRGDRATIMIIDPVNSPQSEPRPLPSNANSFNQRPSWSPDGSQIVYQQGKDTFVRSTLLVVNADGRTDAQIVKSHEKYAGAPAWTAR
jgi:Tol biopolymer transport system component